MANTDVVTRQLQAAGFGDIAFRATDGPVMIGSSVEQAVEFQLALGPAGEIFREAGEQARKRRPEIERALRVELARHCRTGGEIVMQSSSWTITATKPVA
jgi:hypothetical protein